LSNKSFVKSVGFNHVESSVFLRFHWLPFRAYLSVDFDWRWLWRRQDVFPLSIRVIYRIIELINCEVLFIFIYYTFFRTVLLVAWLRYIVSDYLLLSCWYCWRDYYWLSN